MECLGWLVNRGVNVQEGDCPGGANVLPSSAETSPQTPLPRYQTPKCWFQGGFRAMKRERVNRREAEKTRGKGNEWDNPG